ncbi:hypothetical protein JRF99_10665, partial [Micrococcus luteus]|nr:hypothetical protein [Micrococcus luteus]
MPAGTLPGTRRLTAGSSSHTSVPSFASRTAIPSSFAPTRDSSAAASTRSAAVRLAAEARRDESAMR